MRDFIRTSARRGTVALLAAAACSLVYGFGSPAGASRATALRPDTPLPVEKDKLAEFMVEWEMIQVPAGTIEMPDPDKPGAKKAVAIKKVWISKTEVPWGLYDVYAFRLDQTDQQKAMNAEAESRPSKPYGAPDRGFGHAGYPALSMHVQAAQQFCKWLSAKTGKKYRIPTEAEWEYACRAGAVTPLKPDAASLEDLAWFWDNADDKTHPIGQKKANAWGFVDMLGNAAEWVMTPDGKGALAGGSFLDKAEKIHSGYRDYYKPEWQAQDAHTPKSKWWLSDGTFVGMRILREE